MCLLYLVIQVDLLYMQNLRSIADIHETGVTAENFHEVSGQCLIFLHRLFLVPSVLVPSVL